MTAKPGHPPDRTWLIPKRGSIGENWWTLDALHQIEAIVSASRIGSARAYARAGRVTDVATGPGVVVARVQGSRRHPYRVALDWPIWTGDPLLRLKRLVAEDRAILADLLSGELPVAFADLLRRCGLSLVPQVLVVERYWRTLDLRIDCNCPAWDDPCKHGVALLLVLLHHWDREPGELLRLRGLDPEGVALHSLTAEPEAGEPGSFYRAGPGLAGVAVDAADPTDPTAVLHALGPLPLQVGKQPVVPALTEAYAILAAGAAAWGQALIRDGMDGDG
jgi:hypothetical protein